MSTSFNQSFQPTVNPDKEHLQVPRFGMGIAVHLGSPFQKAPQISALAPQKFPEFQKTDLGHLDTGVSLDAPEQVGAAPRREAMAFSRVPQKTKSVAHKNILTLSMEIHRSNKP